MLPKNVSRTHAYFRCAYTGGREHQGLGAQNIVHFLVAKHAIAKTTIFGGHFFPNSHVAPTIFAIWVVSCMLYVRLPKQLSGSHV